MADLDSRRAKIRNALVSSTFKLGTDEELMMIAGLFVKAGSAGKLATSDVWQHFGPLFCEQALAALF